MRGYVYELISHSAGLRYIGSTFQPPQRMMSKHVQTYKDFIRGGRPFHPSYLVLAHRDAKLFALEEVEFDEYYELALHETKYQKDMRCVNLKTKKTEPIQII